MNLFKHSLNIFLPLLRQRVREQIARDKAERAAKFGKMSPSATTPTGGTPSAPPAAPQQEPAAASAAKKEYDEARIQVRRDKEEGWLDCVQRNKYWNN